MRFVPFRATNWENLTKTAPRFRGQIAKFEPKNTAKLGGGNARRTNRIHACTGGGYRTFLGGVLSSLRKPCATWGIAAIAPQYRVIQGH